MITFNKYLKAFLLIMFAMPIWSEASTTITTKINKITLYEDARVIIVYPETPVTFPSGTTKNECAITDYVSFKPSRVMADEYYSGLLLAFASDLPVQMTIMNDCVDHAFSLTLIYYSLLKE